MPAPRLSRSDLLLPAVVGLVGSIEILVAGDDRVVVGVGTFMLGASALAWRRQMPLVVPLVIAGVYALTPVLGFDVSEPGSWILVLALADFGAGLNAPRSRWPLGLASVLGSLAITLAGLTWLTDFEPSLLFGAIVSLGSWALGLGLREALEQNRRAGAMAERARVEQAVAGERAVAAERERIAGELHDVLAHSLGAMVLQSSAAGDLVRRDPEAARTALEAVADVGREALAETGRLLRLLRDDGAEPGPSGNASHEGHRFLAHTAAHYRVTIRDTLLPAVFAIAATVEILDHDYGRVWASLGACWLAAGLLCARRVLPLAMPLGVTAIILGAPLLGADTEDPASWLLLGALAFFSAGRYETRARLGGSVASLLAALLALAIGSIVRDGLTVDVVLALAWVVAPWSTGIAVRETLERARVHAAEAERAKLEGELEAERAAAVERRLIARELHDVLTSSLSVMVVQASLAADLLAWDHDGATTAVTRVESCGRTALREVGRLLRLIRAGADSAGTDPQHGVADIPALAEEFSHAGLHLDVEVEPVALPLGVDVSIYRVVQEALTNVLKHAPGSPVRVRLASSRSSVEVEVVNGRSAVNGSPPAPTSGYGLTGLRERVALFGGVLATGPTDDGGYHLAVTIPLAESQ
jgi:signal transduction histidine kinase